MLSGAINAAIGHFLTRTGLLYPTNGFFTPTTATLAMHGAPAATNEAAGW